MHVDILCNVCVKFKVDTHSCPNKMVENICTSVAVFEIGIYILISINMIKEYGKFRVKFDWRNAMAFGLFALLSCVFGYEAFCAEETPTQWLFCQFSTCYVVEQSTCIKAQHDDSWHSTFH